MTLSARDLTAYLRQYAAEPWQILQAIDDSLPANVTLYCPQDYARAIANDIISYYDSNYDVYPMTRPAMMLLRNWLDNRVSDAGEYWNSNDGYWYAVGHTEGYGWACTVSAPPRTTTIHIMHPAAVANRWAATIDSLDRQGRLHCR